MPWFWDDPDPAAQAAAATPVTAAAPVEWELVDPDPPPPWNLDAQPCKGSEPPLLALEDGEPPLPPLPPPETARVVISHDLDPLGPPSFTT